jgi:hypothetical protein
MHSSVVIVLGLELLKEAHESLLLILTLDQLLVRLTLERAEDAKEKALDVDHRQSLLLLFITAGPITKLFA